MCPKQIKWNWVFGMRKFDNLTPEFFYFHYALNQIQTQKSLTTTIVIIHSIKFIYASRLSCYERSQTKHRAHPNHP